MEEGCQGKLAEVVIDLAVPLVTGVGLSGGFWFQIEMSVRKSICEDPECMLVQ